jgi:hypothetical protein
VLGTKFLWNDEDDITRPSTPTFPSSAAVFSGHGIHQYWKLTEPLLDLETIETLNRIIEADLPNSDACHNANRLMRVPGTINPGDPNKDETPVRTKLLRRSPGIVYEVRDFLTLAALTEDIRDIIRTGDYDSAKYASRSERDWAVITALVKAQASDRLITLLYDHADVGDKYKEHTKPVHYLATTIAKVRQQTGIADAAIYTPNSEPSAMGGVPAGDDAAKSASDPTDAAALVKTGKPGGTAPPKKRGRDATIIVEREDGYYLVTALEKRLSTFTLDPQVLLEGLDVPDAMVCDVHAGGRVWKGVAFPRTAFTSVAQMDKHCNSAAWQWLGTDAELRMMLPYLLAKHSKAARPHVSATPMLGYHVIGGEPMFLGDGEVLLRNASYQGTSGPLAWIPSQKSHPKMRLTATVDQVVTARSTVVGGGATKQSPPSTLLQLNEQSVIWPLLGWFAAASVKPWLESLDYRFPLLNVTGTKESGKTTLLKLLMRLWGQLEPQAYDSMGTPFVRLALLGSSNAIPIYFNEFRYSSDGGGKKAESFMHDLRMLYDSGSSPRGRADRTTEDFPLSAPTIVDGEDPLSDPALRDRMIAVRMNPKIVEEGTAAHAAYGRFYAAIKGMEQAFGAGYIQWALAAVASGKARELLDAAQKEMFERFPTKLGDRTRSNYILALFGTKMFSEYAAIDCPDAEVMRASMSEITNLASGRARTVVDDFTEAIVNGVKQYGMPGFACMYDRETKQLWFQLATAHEWWTRRQKTLGKTALERNSIRAQLREAPYFAGDGNVHNTFMYAISLQGAVDAGLDIPTDLSVQKIAVEVIS